MGYIYDWCEERLEIQSISDDILAKFVPSHVNIFYCFGGIVLTSFIFQVATGFALTIYYRPTVVDFNVNLGWFIRFVDKILQYSYICFAISDFSFSSNSFFYA